jgi:hypothetical protein
MPATTRLSFSAAIYENSTLLFGRIKNSATEDPMGRHVQGSSRRTVVANNQNPWRIEYTHTTFVEPRLHTPQHKLEVATPGHLVMQLPTYQTEVKLHYVYQV